MFMPVPRFAAGSIAIASAQVDLAAVDGHRLLGEDDRGLRLRDRRALDLGVARAGARAEQAGHALAERAERVDGGVRERLELAGVDLDLGPADLHAAIAFE